MPSGGKSDLVPYSADHSRISLVLVQRGEGGGGGLRYKKFVKIFFSTLWAINFTSPVLGYRPGFKDRNSVWFNGPLKCNLVTCYNNMCLDLL